MELIKKRVRTNVLGKTVMDQFTVDDDYNVPDVKGDIGRVILGEGTVRIEDVRKAENYLRVAGKLQFRVLYATDAAEPSLASLDGRIPFEEMIYLDEEGDGDYAVQAARVEVSVTLVHSRKLAVKAVVELAVHREQMTEEETTVDVEGEADIYRKKRKLELLQLHTAKRDVYRIREERLLPGTKENIGTLLWTDVSGRRLDTKLVQDALLLTGELQVFCFYESQEGKTEWATLAVPYEGRIECMGVDEGMYHHVYDELTDVSVEARLDEDGEMRALGVEATLAVRLQVYEEEQAEVLEDVYSLRQECIPKKREAVYEELLTQNHSKCKITERLTLPELKGEILQICHSSGSVQVERMETVPEGIQVEGVLHVSFLYVKANDAVPFDMWQGMVPFSCLLESRDAAPDMRYDVTYDAEQLAVELSGSDEVEIKAVLAFRSFLRRPVRTEVITELETAPYEESEAGKRPGIVGYIVKPGDDLWTLAKRYRATVEGIREINGLTGEEPKEGEKILIFKENVSIL